MAEPERLSWRKGSETEVREATAGENLTEIVTWYDHMDDVDIDPAKLQIEEGKVVEVMKRLEEEINRPCGGGGDGGEGAPWFHDHRCQLVQLVPSPSPSSSSSAVALAASTFVTINGNEESCGPSFSDSASTVMASIDTRGVPWQAIPAAKDEMEEIWLWLLEPEAGAAFGDQGEPAAAGGGGGGGAATVGSAVEDADADDDEWLERVLSGAGFELETER